MVSVCWDLNQDCQTQMYVAHPANQSTMVGIIGIIHVPISQILVYQETYLNKYMYGTFSKWNEG